MPQIRVIVSMTAASAQDADELIRQRVAICEQVEAEEEGCLQYEVFRSSMRPERYMLVELWADKAVFDKHAKRVRKEAGASSVPKPKSNVEMYQVQHYAKLDGVWQAADPDDRMDAIRWY